MTSNPSLLPRPEPGGEPWSRLTPRSRGHIIRACRPPAARRGTPASAGGARLARDSSGTVPGSGCGREEPRQRLPLLGASGRGLCGWARPPPPPSLLLCPVRLLAGLPSLWWSCARCARCRPSCRPGRTLLVFLATSEERGGSSGRCPAQAADGVRRLRHLRGRARRCETRPERGE